MLLSSGATGLQVVEIYQQRPAHVLGQLQASWLTSACVSQMRQHRIVTSSLFAGL